MKLFFQCPNCHDIVQCGCAETSGRDAVTGIYYFQRMRRCPVCKHSFHTVEVEQKWLRVLELWQSTFANESTERRALRVLKIWENLEKAIGYGKCTRCGRKRTLALVMAVKPGIKEIAPHAEGRRPSMYCSECWDHEMKFRREANKTPGNPLPIESFPKLTLRWGRTVGARRTEKS